MDPVVRPRAPELRTARLRGEPLRVEHADEATVAVADPALHRRTGGQLVGTVQATTSCARAATGRSR